MLLVHWVKLSVVRLRGGSISDLTCHSKDYLIVHEASWTECKEKIDMI